MNDQTLLEGEEKRIDHRWLCCGEEGQLWERINLHWKVNENQPLLEDEEKKTNLQWFVGRRDNVLKRINLH